MALILLLRFRAQSLLLFYVYFESALLAIFLMVMGWGYQPERFPAGLALVFYTLFASLPLLVAILLVGKVRYAISFQAVVSLGGPALGRVGPILAAI